MLRVFLFAAALGCLGFNSARAVDPWVGQGKVTWTRMVSISVQSPQTIVKISRDIGDPVKKGEILVQCDDKLAKIALNMTKLLLRKAELEAKNAETKVAIAKNELKAKLYLHDKKVISKGEVERAEVDIALALGQLEVAKVDFDIQKELVADAERKIEALVLRAPFDGFVMARFSEAGDVVTGAAPILNIVGGSTVQAEVPDRLVKYVGPKHPVDVSLLQEFGGGTFKGEISRMSNIIDPEKRSFTIQVALPEAVQKSLPYGMVVNMKIAGNDKDKDKNKE